MQFKSKMGQDGKLEFIGGSLDVPNRGKTHKVKFDSVGTLKSHLEEEIKHAQMVLGNLLNQYGTITRAFDPETLGDMMQKFAGAEKFDMETDPSIDLKFYIDSAGNPQFRDANITMPYITTLGGETVESVDGLCDMLVEHKKTKVADKIRELFSSAPTKEEIAEVLEERTRPGAGAAARVVHKADLEALRKVDPERVKRIEELRELAKNGRAPVRRAEQRRKQEDLAEIKAKAYTLPPDSLATVPQTNVFDNEDAKMANKIIDGIASVAGTMIGKASFPIQTNGIEMNATSYADLGAGIYD